ncbi:MAG: hypothetical protein RLO50_19605, partial [Azospirillaceae bacterium]
MADLRTYFAESAFLGDRWAEDVRITVNDAGIIRAVEEGVAEDEDELLAGPVLPGLVDAHADSLLRAVAGRVAPFTRHFGALNRWRQGAHATLAAASPERVEAIVAQSYLERVKSGFTTVIETVPLGFGEGDPGKPVERAGATVAAAHQVGLSLSLLAVLDGMSPGATAPPGSGPSIARAFASRAAGDPLLRFGLGFRSLHRLDEAEIADWIARIQSGDAMAPVQIVIGGDLEETHHFRTARGLTPLAWCLENLPVDGRWSVVHANHCAPDELAELAATDAVAVVCPTFEAALGLPPLPLDAFLGAAGKLALGTGAPMGLGAAEEARALLIRHRQLARARGGGGLIPLLLEGGAQAAGQNTGQIATGYRCDLVVLDPDHAAIAGQENAAILD